MVFADGPTQDATLSEFERLYNDGVRVFISGYGCIADRTFATMADDMQALYLSLAWDATCSRAPAPISSAAARTSTISPGAR